MAGAIAGATGFGPETANGAGDFSAATGATVGDAGFTPMTGAATGATGGGAGLTPTTGAATGLTPATWDGSGGARGGCQACTAGAEAAGAIAGLAGAGAPFATGPAGAGATVCAAYFTTDLALVTAGEGDGGSSGAVADAGAETGDAVTTAACAVS